jgi:phage terminase large subunit GpA-like protein
VLAGLRDLTGLLLSREWEREDGAIMSLNPLGVDVGWEMKTTKMFCRRHPRRDVIKAFRGQGITAAGRPLSDYDKTRGDQIGFHWWIPRPKDNMGREFRPDINYYKQFMHERFRLPLGAKGGLTIFGNRAQDHKLLASHLCAESAQKTYGNGRWVWEFKQRPNTDNHWLDNVVGCLAGLSFAGAQMVTVQQASVAGAAVAKAKLPTLEELRAKYKG